MPNPVKDSFLTALKGRYGSLVKLPRSNSLYEIGNSSTRIYIRYSKVHPGGQTFFGLRKSDLQQLDGHDSFVVFLWDSQSSPLFLPYASYEGLFNATEPAADGQYKAQIYIDADSVELYMPRLGRFNLEGLFGWSQLDASVRGSDDLTIPALTHGQVQSLITAIGAAKGYDIWIPPNDRGRLDAAYVTGFTPRDALPPPLAAVFDVLQEIDIVWLRPGSNDIAGMFDSSSTPRICN